MTNFKDLIDEQILNGMIFSEDYSIDNKEHFSLAPNDVVKIDMRTHLKNIIGDIKDLRKSTYGQVEVDDVTGDVSINNEKLQSNNSSENNAADTVSPDVTKQSEISDDVKKDIVEFIRLLKNNGSLEKLKGMDTATKMKIADTIKATLNSPAKKPTSSTKNTLNTLASDSIGKTIDKNSLKIIASGADSGKKAQQIVDDLRSANGGNYDVTDNIKHIIGKALGEVGKSEDTSLLKEAYSIVSELDTPVTKDDVINPTKTTAKPTNEPKEKKLDPTNASTLEVVKNTNNYNIDPNDDKFKKVVSYIKKLKTDYDTIISVPGAKEKELIAAVVGVDEDNGTVDVDLLQKTTTNKDGTSQYGKTNKVFTIPQHTVTRRTPAQELKKKGLFSKFFGK
jgi:hypothetical protein